MRGIDCGVQGIDCGVRDMTCRMQDKFNIFVPYFERQISAGFLHRGL